VRKTAAALLPVLLAVLLVPLSVSTASAGTSGEAPPAGACADPSGVTVVVDLTDVGGTVLVGCAPGDPATGRQALVDAGFRTADAPTGMICAINSAPDPCPVTFEGAYWSYWSAQAGAPWTAYPVGADSSDPAPGGFEGWRYNDGTTGPSVLPADLQKTTATAAPAPAPNDPATAQGPTPATIAGLGLVTALLVAAVLVARRRRADGARRD